MAFHPIRSFTRISATDIFEGVYLEGLEPTLSGTRPGVVLAHHDWSAIYFVKERRGWDEEDYFEFAQTRFHQLGIKDP